MERTYETECAISTESSIHTRRCFMTGEYCSQKTNIQRERENLYRRDDHIVVSAFVIMNFSDMSDVVYKWRIKTFIESLKKYLRMDVEQHKLYCVADRKCEKEGTVHVKEIRVIRSDSDPASNYVICSRICQQMQIADLIIVDVSQQNPNVFYEFGMAVALDKLILPICFSESFYKIEYPDGVRKMEKELRKDVERHIGCYPWRKNLQEYYGIRYKKRETTSKGSGTRYEDFDKITDEEKGFSDWQYGRFPYDAELPVGGQENKDKKTGEKIGERIYELLKSQYNEADENGNTLVVYTMEGFLNEDQAGQCIVNFYHSITKRMKEKHCFCGERVGVLVQGNGIPESDKDAKKERNLLYNVGEIIRIGVNQATYLASKKKMLSEEVLWCPKTILDKERLKKFPTDYRKNIKNSVKEHIRNRGMIIYPNNPVYVEREKNLFPNENWEGVKDTPYLFYVMLNTLCYANEIVVDISNNCLQSLFWLGAAHGSEIYAVTVKHELSDKQKEIVFGDPTDRNRNVFDVSGLWTAHYFSHDTEGFYHQLALAQFGIEKHSKIIPAYEEWHGMKRWEYFEEETDVNEEKDEADTIGETQNQGGDSSQNDKKDTAKEKEKLKELALESYYRRRFWNAMLRYNRLRIYLAQRDDMDSQDKEPRVRAAKWDIDAASSLTHYLSKRSMIGDYMVITLPESEVDAKAVNENAKAVDENAEAVDENAKAVDENAEAVNFICVGQPTKPLTKTLSMHIFERCNGCTFGNYEKVYKKLEHTGNEVCGGEDNTSINIVHEHCDCKVSFRQPDEQTTCKLEKAEVQIKGFSRVGQENVEKQEREGLFSARPWADCIIQCEPKPGQKYGKIYKKPSQAEKEPCPMRGQAAHTEIAQLLLWREDGESGESGKRFRVSIVGSSGPATYGLSSLFVDESQKFYDFLKKPHSSKTETAMEDENAASLCELQKRVREKLYVLLMGELEIDIMNILRKHESSEEKSIEILRSPELSKKEKQRLELYRDLVIYAMYSYLSTVLYRYFLPFLTEKDINSIYNGVYLFVNSMKVARQSPFCLEYKKYQETNDEKVMTDACVKEIIKMLPGKVKRFLERVKGLEAFYEVTVEVKHGQGEAKNAGITKDWRKVTGIKSAEGKINIFILPEPSETELHLPENPSAIS